MKLSDKLKRKVESGEVELAITTNMLGPRTETLETVPPDCLRELFAEVTYNDVPIGYVPLGEVFEFTVTGKA